MASCGSGSNYSWYKGLGLLTDCRTGHRHHQGGTVELLAVELVAAVMAAVTAAAELVVEQDPPVGTRSSWWVSACEAGVSS